eukprot:7272149-Pyramimonas_sp.AAC.9
MTSTPYDSASGVIPTCCIASTTCSASLWWSCTSRSPHAQRSAAKRGGSGGACPSRSSRANTSTPWSSNPAFVHAASAQLNMSLSNRKPACEFLADTQTRVYLHAGDK